MAKALGNHFRVMNSFKSRMDVLNEELIRKIEALPENPRITRIDKNCFSIGVNDLGTKNWTQFYHDFTQQYKFIRAVVENFDLNQVESILIKIMNEGEYRLTRKITSGDAYTFESKVTYKFHPDVIQFLKENM